MPTGARVGTESGVDAAHAAAEVLRVDEDPTPPAGEPEDSPGQRQVGQRRETDAQAVARGFGVGMQKDVQTGSAQVDEQVG